MGAVVVVIDAPPMNEFIDSNSGILIPSSDRREMGLVHRHIVSETSIELTINKIIAMPQKHLKELGEAARNRYLTEGQLFRERMALLLDLLCNDTH